MNGGAPFYGKYRGVVSDVQDTLFQGRIKAYVPDVLGTQESGWAMPCAPFGGDGVGLFVLPKVGAGVWIEFEHGDPEYPIWSGCWFGSTAQVPSDVYTPQPYKKVYLKTEGGIVVSLDDTPGTGGISLKTSGGQELNLTSQSVEIKFSSSCSIKLSSSGVSVNNGALEVL